MGALANPVRLALVRRLQEPAFIPDLAKEAGLTRQALKKHLDELVEAGIVQSTVRRRGAMPAALYSTDAAGFFALREMVADLGPAQASPADQAVARPTTIAGRPAGLPRVQGAGLLLVHGDRPGRWFPLEHGKATVIGRDPACGVALPYDGYASAQHARIEADGKGWRLSDLHSTNGTRLDFIRIGPGATVRIGHGDLLTVGRTHLAFRDGA